MLFGISVVVAIAAVIFLIVFNIKAAKPSKQQSSKGRAQPKDAETAVRPAEATQEAAAKQSEPPIVTPILPEETKVQAEIMEERQEQELKPKADRPRTTPSTLLNREHSDNDYREALRSFSAKSRTEGASTGPEDASKQTKDNAFREGLRSLSQKDELR